MSSYHFTAILVVLIIFSPISTIATTYNHTETCSETFSGAVDRKITKCNKLSTLGAEFGWRLQSRNDSVFDICIGAALHTEEGWLGWGVNPQDQPQMAGTRAIIAIRKLDGSTFINTYNVTSETKLGCRLMPSKDIDIEVEDMKFNYLDESNYYMICARVRLPSSYNVSNLNHVWQVGYQSDGLEPLVHKKTLQNVDSAETINLLNGNSESSIGPHRRRMRKAHGVLNIAGWGTLIPIGVIIARYFRKFPFHYEHWIRPHIGCQITGYTLGTIGWGIGLWLGRASKYSSFPTHGLISTFIFAFTTLQMFALRLKPHSNDDYRKYWSMYHHFLGYALLALIMYNIFRGIRIFTPSHNWRWAYIGVLCGLGFITLCFEIFTWFKFLHIKRKQKHPEKNHNKQGP